jgi:hypothetical protein
VQLLTDVTIKKKQPYMFMSGLGFIKTSPSVKPNDYHKGPMSSSVLHSKCMTARELNTKGDAQ